MYLIYAVLIVCVTTIIVALINVTAIIVTLIKEK
jgi:hypothetical protein